MTVKLFGAIVILILSAALVLRGVSVFRERVAELEGFLLLLRHIRDEISCFRTPAHEILSSFHNEALERAGLLPLAPGTDLASALASARDRLYLDSDELAILSEFCDGFGRGYVTEELARCDLATSRLTDAIARRREALPKTCKLFRTLVMSGALAVIIVLL